MVKFAPGTRTNGSLKPLMNTGQHGRNQTKILSCQERILGLVIQMDTDVARIHLCESVFIRGFPRRYEVAG